MPKASRTRNFRPKFGFTFELLVARHPKLKRKKAILGFTLIELLVVISIIAILITVIAATFGTTQAKARDNRRKTDLDALKKALELHKTDTPGSSWYPDCRIVATSCTLLTRDDLNPSLQKIYIKDFPIDPDGVTGYTYDVSSASKCQDFKFPDGTPSRGCDAYSLTACLENENDSNRDAKDGDSEDLCGRAGPDGLVSYTITNP